MTFCRFLFQKLRRTHFVALLSLNADKKVELERGEAEKSDSHREKHYNTTSAVRQDPTVTSAHTAHQQKVRMGLPSKDTAGKKTAYHPGLPMKVLPPLLGVTKDYAVVRKSRLIAGAIDASTEIPTRSTSPLSPISMTSEKETAPQVSPPAAHSGSGFVEPPRSMSSSPGDTTSSPRPGSSPMGHKTPSSPMFYPIALPIPVAGPEPLELTTTSSNKIRQTSANSTLGSVTIFPSLSANVSHIPEGVLQTDGNPRTLGTSTPDLNEKVEPKLSRKQNRLIMNLDDTEKPPFPPYTQERLLMRPWLMERLELGDIPGKFLFLSTLV